MEFFKFQMQNYICQNKYGNDVTLLWPCHIKVLWWWLGEIFRSVSCLNSLFCHQVWKKKFRSTIQTALAFGMQSFHTSLSNSCGLLDAVSTYHTMKWLLAALACIGAMNLAQISWKTWSWTVRATSQSRSNWGQSTVLAGSVLQQQISNSDSILLTPRWKITLK